MRPSRSATGAGAGTVALLLLLLAVLVASQVPAAPPVTCSPSELLPCAGAILFGARPSDACCAKLREQQPCFCQYLQDPSLSGYVNSPNARRVAADCAVPDPNC